MGSTSNSASISERIIKQITHLKAQAMLGAAAHLLDVQTASPAQSIELYSKLTGVGSHMAGDLYVFRHSQHRKLAACCALAAYISLKPLPHSAKSMRPQ